MGASVLLAASLVHADRSTAVSAPPLVREPHAPAWLVARKPAFWRLDLFAGAGLGWRGSPDGHGIIGTLRIGPGLVRGNARSDTIVWASLFAEGALYTVGDDRHARATFGAHVTIFPRLQSLVGFGGSVLVEPSGRRGAAVSFRLLVFALEAQAREAAGGGASRELYLMLEQPRSWDRKR